jgi:hypothetical protein
MAVDDKIYVNFTQGTDYVQKASKFAQQAEDAKNTAVINGNIARSSAISANNAANSAANSANAASQAAEVATTASQQANMYAEMAFGAAAPAWNSSETYNYPQCVAYTDGKTYRCIGDDITGSDIPGQSDKWVSITLDANKLWILDANGNIEPV